ncbi:MAG: sensor histidine kinase, partial [Roseovarius sp.]
NLVDNALRHGAQSAPVDVALTAEGRLVVANEGPVLPRDTLNRLTTRFERAQATEEGSGLGLAIVAAIAERIGSSLKLASPRPGATSGFEVSVVLPTEAKDGPAARETTGP